MDAGKIINSCCHYSVSPDSAQTPSIVLVVLSLVHTSENTIISLSEIKNFQ